MPWIAAISGLAGGAAGAKANSDARDEARRAYEQSVRDYEAMGIPTIEAQKIASEKYRSAGNLDPQLEDAVTLGDSNYGGISTDPRYKEAQLKALDELQGISDGGGYNLSDKAKLEKTLGDINADERGAREAILADSRSKGQMGSGSELVAQLMNQQAAAERSHSTGLNVAAEAQKRALDAIMQRGSMAGSLRSQDYGEQEKAAQARDAIAKWNAQNTQSVRGSNVDRGNNAQQYNLANNQRIMDANTSLGNNDQQYNKGLYQKQFDNTLALNSGKANARSGQANNAISAGQAAANTYQKMGQGVGQVAMAYDGKSIPEEKKKQEYEV